VTRDEMLVETIERLDAAVRKLETIIGGDPDLGYRGLSQRSSIVQWTIGYTMLGMFVAVLATGDLAEMMIAGTAIGLFVGA